MSTTDRRTGGRPRKPADQLLSECLYFRTTTTEADDLHRGALKRGLSLSNYLRERLGFSSTKNKEEDGVGLPCE